MALSQEAAHHVGRVLRKQPGDRLCLFCGDNREFIAEIRSVHKKEVVVEIMTVIDVNRESALRIHLAQALSKGDRMEWVVQKATECGVASITPLHTRYSTVRMDEAQLMKKTNQWQAIAIAACEQSGRNQVPLVASAETLPDFLSTARTGFFLDPRAPVRAGELPKPSQEITLAIGPEGGWDEQECHALLSAGFQSMRLGPRIFRTETAAVVALSVLQAAWGDI